MTAAGELHRRWRTLPVGTLDDVIGRGSALILAPHPDDESLGCGGLIASCCLHGRPPMVVILTDGSFSHPGSQLYPPARLAEVRELEARRAVKILGLPPEHLSFLRAQDSKAPHSGPAFDNIVRLLSEQVRGFDCTAILAPWRHDPHCDHAAAALVAQATARATRVRQISYPVWGWTLSDDALVDEPVVAGWRFDVTTHLAAKRRAIAAHMSQSGGLITDDPDGFRLPVELLRAMDLPAETFLSL